MRTNELLWVLLLICSLLPFGFSKIRPPKTSQGIPWPFRVGFNMWRRSSEHWKEAVSLCSPWTSRLRKPCFATFFSVFQRIISVSNKIISVTEIIIDDGEEAAMLWICQDLPAIRDNYFRHGKDPRRAANDFVRNGKESVRDGRDRGRHIDDHWWDGENRLAGGFHSRCDGNDVREVIGDCRRNGNHYRRGFNKPVGIGNDRGDFPFDR